jgi:hypothetical protein
MQNIWLTFLMMVLCGCHQVKVVDENNHPIAGAKVFSQTPSVTSQANISNELGVAEIPRLLGQNAITIHSAGFDSVFINTEKGFPTLVTLKRLPNTQ